MPTKTITVKGGSLIDTDSPYNGFVADDASGLHYVTKNANGTEGAFSSLTHMVTETNNPLWTQVNYKLTDSLGYTTSNLEGHVTLIGIDQMGNQQDLMQHVYKATESNTNSIKIFDMVQSSCTGGVTTQTANATTAGNVQIGLPKRYDKYESVKLMPIWYNSSWSKRKAIKLTKSQGRIHGTTGHKSDYYGTQVAIIYDADMNSDLSDIRFTGPDGLTICPHYFIRNDTSKSAGSAGGAAIVMIPWQFIDQTTEEIEVQTAGGVVHKYPQYLYMYYGNASATTTSDITLGGNAIISDAFDQNSINSQWTVNQTDVTYNPITPSTTGMTMGCTTSAAVGSSCRLTMNLPVDYDNTADEGWECIVKFSDITAHTVTQGLIFRLRGQTLTTSYIDARLNYATPRDMGNGATAGYCWGVNYQNASVGTPVPNYYKTQAALSSGQVYMKFRWNRSLLNNYAAVHISWNGYDWDYLGKVRYQSTVFDTADNLAIQLWYNVAGVAATGSFKMKHIVMYPVMGDDGGIWVDHFQDSRFINRYTTLYNNTYRTITETGGQLQLGTNGTTVDTSHTIAIENSYRDPLCVMSTVKSATAADNASWSGDRILYGAHPQEDVIYETEVASMTAPTTASDYTEAGLMLHAGVADTSMTTTYGITWGIRRTTAGVRTFVRGNWNPSTVNASSTGSWADADLPIRLRVRANHFNNQATYEYKKVGSGGDWIAFAVDAGTGNDTYQGKGTCMFGCYIRGVQTIAEARTVAFNYLENRSGGQRLLQDQPIDWLAEESYTAAAISPSPTPNANDLTITFPSATIVNSKQPYTVQFTEFGGGISNSKPFYFNDKDYVQIGPDGTDKYIGMKLEFNFQFEGTDTFQVSEINYVYEVI